MSIHSANTVPVDSISTFSLDQLYDTIVKKTKDFATRLFLGAIVGTALLAIKKTKDSSLEGVDCFTLKNFAIYSSIGCMALYTAPKIYSYFFGNNDFEKSE